MVALIKLCKPPTAQSEVRQKKKKKLNCFLGTAASVLKAPHYFFLTWFKVATKCFYLSHGLLKKPEVNIYHMALWFTVATRHLYGSHDPLK